jgi:hypothetical protein
MRLLRTTWTSFRSVAATLKQLASHEKIERAPSAETLIQWDLKIGLHRLERPKPTNERWVWMADHVIRLGIYKCFVIVGVRMATLMAKKDLTISLEDLEPMAISPMEISNGTEVARKLEDTVQKVGFSPCALVIDHGSDLYAGAQLFCKTHPGTLLKYDVCHKVACELKRMLKGDVLWERLTSNAVQTRKALSLSKFAKFAPPQQRSKARYMNLDSLVRWGCNTLDQYEILPEEVRNKVVWLLPLRESIHKWQEWVQIGQVTRDVVRKEGFYEGVDEILMDKLIEMKLVADTSEGFTEILLDYVNAESRGVLTSERLVGTTEALEGLFGGYKRMVGDNRMSLNGLGRLILCMSSRMGEFSEDLVNKAMVGVKCEDVNQWLSQAFGSDKGFLEQKWEHSYSEEACNF